MTDDNHTLTRRRLLAGVGGIGAASAAAGLGTTAYLNDTESFTGNTLQAGALNMMVSVDIHDKSTELPDPVVESTDEDADDTADGNEITITVDDVKPGDWFVLDWHVEIDGNPGYVQVTSVDEDYSNGEGDNPESETDTTSPGDLGGALLTTVWRSTDSTAGSGRGVLQTLDRQTDHNDTWLSGYETPDLDGVTTGGAHYTTLDETHGEYLDGVVLTDQSGAPIEVGSVSDSADFHYYQLFELPLGVGNDVQGDSVTFTTRFDAEQVRNNDAPFGYARTALGSSAAQNTGFQAVAGDGFLGSGYWTDDPNQTNQDGGDYEQLYVTFEEAFGPYYVDPLATFTVGDIESVRYRTRRPPGATQDYFLEIYTFPDGSNDDAGWYGRQLQALPGDALNQSVSPNSWLTWRTESGTNQLTFYDYNHDYDTTDSNSPPYLGQDTGVTLADLQSTGSFDWSNYVSTADSTPKNYRDEEVRALRFATGSGWEDTHQGDLDAIEVELTDGRSVLVDLGP